MEGEGKYFRGQGIISVEVMIRFRECVLDIEM